MATKILAPTPTGASGGAAGGLKGRRAPGAVASPRLEEELVVTGQAEPTATGGPGRPSPRTRRRRSRRGRRSQIVVWLLVVAAAVGGAFAGCHPTGNAVLDPLYSAALAGAVTYLASRSGRAPLLILTTVGVVLSRGWLWAPSGAALVLAFSTAFMKRAYRRFDALIGAVAVQVMLRWPHIGPYGVTAAVAAAAIALLAFSAWRHRSARAGNRPLRIGGAVAGLAVVLSLPFVISALSAWGSVSSGIKAAHRALADVESSDPSAAVADLTAASNDLRTAHARVHGWWNGASFLVPVVAQQRRAVDRLTAIGWQLTSAASKEAGAIDFNALRYANGRVDLAAVGALNGPVDRLDADVARTQAQLRDSRRHSDWLIPPITDKTDHLAAELAKARKETGLAVLGVKDAPALLGADGARHYLVVFLSPSETRGLGGFIGAYGVLTVEDGHVSLGQAGLADSFVKPGQKGLHLVAPPDYVARYGSFKPQLHFMDLTYSPDFPSDAQAISAEFEQVTGTQVDGVMAVDPYTLAALLRFTGPITLQGLPYKLTSQNAADVLLRRQYLEPSITNSQRHDLLQVAMSAAFSRLTSGSLPSAKRLANALDPLVRQGRLLFWSDHPADQPLLHRVALDGAFPQADGGDLLAVTVANAANNKIDDYLRESIDDHVGYDPRTGHVDSNLTITLRNTAPSSGMPDYVIGSFAGSGFPPGTNYMWLSLYSPLAVTASTLDGQPVSFSGALPEAGSQAYSLFVKIPSGSTATLSVRLSGDISPGPDYRLTTWLQPLVVTPSLSVTTQSKAGGEQNTWSATKAQVQHLTVRDPGS